MSTYTDLKHQSTAIGSRDPLQQQETEGDAEMRVFEAIAESSKRTLEEREFEEKHARRQRVEHFEAGHRGDLVGDPHRRGKGEAFQGSGVVAC